ncbi:hypothetical protein SO802_000743 [Lithocarpus litseifolius]|uniref:Prolamin-like domain-containing protein n=1 Tax=Lithocarpus litseifolius TaxID=425828 RepID=A0AAW2DW62_9ROSI
MAKFKSPKTALILLFACLAVLVPIGIIGSSCCKAVSEIEGNCLTNLFPFNPIFASLLNNSCSQPSNGNGKVFELTASKAAFSGLLPGNQDIQQCWSSLSGIPGCLTDVINSLFSGRVSFFGTTCSKAITLVNGHCLPKLFPFNPAFHSILKNIFLTGSGVGGDAPSPSPSSPLGANQIAVSKLSLLVKLPFQRILGNWKQDISKCWSLLSSINWCIDEIYGHFPGANLVWMVVLVAYPSVLLVTSVGPRYSHSTHCSLNCSKVNVVVRLHQNLGEFDHAYEFGQTHHWLL